MGFFERSKGAVIFTAGKHKGRPIDDVARTDPNYLRWARRDMTVGVSDAVHAEIDKVMISNGVPFTVTRKSSPRSKK